MTDRATAIDWGDVRASGSHLLMFAGGSRRYASAGRRMHRQAERSELFTNVVLLQGHDLAELARTREPQLPQVRSLHSKGCGFWWWKAAILNAYVHVPELKADRVFYIDVGSHLNTSQGSLQRFHDYERIADSNGAVLFSIPGHTDRDWTRPDVAQHLGMTETELDSEQVSAGFFGFALDTRARDALGRWDALCRFDGGTLLLDVDASSEHVRHRHDQSLFSAVVKRMGYQTLADETYTHGLWHQDGRDWPVWAVRNRGGATFSKHRGWFRMNDSLDRLTCWLSR